MLKRLPIQGQNNLWYVDRQTEDVLVFVHGILSDSRSCWLNDEAQTYWPKMLVDDTQFDRYSIFLGGYYTAVDAGPYDVADCSRELLSALNRAIDGSRSVLSRKRVTFICHSTGGIVARYMLESNTVAFTGLSQIGLVLIASPSYGSTLSTRLNWLTNFYNNKLGIRLEWGNWSLQDLDDRFKKLISEEQLPHMHGVEAYENHFIIHRRWLPDRSLVVTKESAGRYFGPPVLLRKTNHFTSVKPDTPKHPAYELVVDFLVTLREKVHGATADDLPTSTVLASPTGIAVEAEDGDPVETGRTAGPLVGTASDAERRRRGTVVGVLLLVLSASSIFGYLLGRSTSEDFSKADGVTGYLIKNATWKAFSKTEGELSVLAGTRRYVYRTGDAAPRAEYVPTPEARSAFDGLFGAINSKPLDWMRGPDVAIAGVGGAAGTSMILLNRVGTFTQAEARILATAALFTGGVFGYWLGNKDIGNIESGPFNDRLASDTKLWRGLDARYQALCTAFKISEVMLRTWELTNSKENEDLKSKTPLDAEFTRQVLSMTKWREKVPVEFQLGCIQS